MGVASSLKIFTCKYSLSHLLIILVKNRLYIVSYKNKNKTFIFNNEQYYLYGLEAFCYYILHFFSAHSYITEYSHHSTVGTYISIDF